MQTPVGLFSALHAESVTEPSQAKFYKQLIPLSKPEAGEQYAFKVDLDRCTGCKACVSACHSLNGLEENETWRDVGMIHGASEIGAYTQTVTSACHHCVDPACLNGCPVLAYEKDPETGIVRHLDDQCIGCQYCVLKCPYDVPKYSKALGIVRKCDMCHSRLAEGEAPACVQACPTEAICITIVDTNATTVAAKGGAPFLAGAPNPDYTVPTTQYISNRVTPKITQAADHTALRPEHGHYPLVVMLVLTQLSVGLYGWALLAGEGPTSVAARVVAFLAMGLGLAASTSHLGRPLGAWRAFLGLRRSWLSREIIVFGGFSAVASGYTLTAFTPWMPAGVVLSLGGMTLVGGLFGVFCSAMIYHDTRRPFWRLPVAGGKFFGSTVVLGSAVYAVIAVIMDAAMIGPLLLTAGCAVLKCSMEAGQLVLAGGAEMTPERKSALLMRRPLRRWMRSRYLGGMLGAASLFGAAISGALAAPILSLVFAVIGCVGVLLGELCERVLFFKAVVAPKMPGGYHT